MIKQSNCAALFGNPSERGWAEKHLAHVAVPRKLMMGNILIKNIKVNKVCSEDFEKILEEFWEACGKDQKRVEREGMGVFSGDWVVRQARGLKITSMHAYGLAVDFNAPKNPLGAPEALTAFKGSSLIVKIFERHGWTWGGRWKTRRDAMHFQYPKVG